MFWRLKHFINVRNCYAKDTSINWSAVTVFLRNSQCIQKQTQINQGKMFYVKVSHTFSFHDFLKNFNDPSSWELPSSLRFSRWSQHGTPAYTIVKYL